MKLADAWALLRPAQWIKNGFVLLALVFSLHLTDRAAVLRTLATFVLFCLASSAAYIWNDVADAGRDALHATKRDRPVAAGRISRGSAVVLSLLLATSAVTGAMLLGRGIAACLGSFLFLQGAYSLVLKHYAVVDAITLATGFVLRTLAGVVAADARMSTWLFLASFLLAIFLAVGKRRAELASLGGAAAEHRPALALYGRISLDPVLALLAAVVVALYSVYSLSADVAERLGTDRLWLTVPFVVGGVFRYLFLIYGRDQGGNPTEALLGDVPLLACIASWAATAILLIYL